MADYDALLSLACGAGIGFLAKRLPDKPVLAGADTTLFVASSFMAFLGF